MIDEAKHSLNAKNSTDCADVTISNDTADELFATAINDGDSTNFSDNSAGGLITAINSTN